MHLAPRTSQDYSRGDPSADASPLQIEDPSGLTPRLVVFALQPAESHVKLPVNLGGDSR